MGMRFDKVDPRLYMELGKAVGGAYVKSQAGEANAEGMRQSTQTTSNYGKQDPNALFAGEGSDGAMTNSEAASYGLNVPTEDKAAGTGTTRQYGLGKDPQQWQDKEFTPDQQRIGGLRAQMAYYDGRGQTDESDKIRTQIASGEADARAVVADKRAGESHDMQMAAAKQKVDDDLKGRHILDAYSTLNGYKSRLTAGADPVMIAGEMSQFYNEHPTMQDGQFSSIQMVNGVPTFAHGPKDAPTSMTPVTKESVLQGLSMGGDAVSQQLALLNPTSFLSHQATETAKSQHKEEVGLKERKLAQDGDQNKTWERVQMAKIAQDREYQRGMIGRASGGRDVSPATTKAINDLVVQYQNSTDPKERALLERQFNMLQGQAANELGKPMQLRTEKTQLAPEAQQKYRDAVQGLGRKPKPGTKEAVQYDADRRDLDALYGVGDTQSSGRAPVVADPGRDPRTPTEPKRGMAVSKKQEAYDRWMASKLSWPQQATPTSARAEAEAEAEFNRYSDPAYQGR